MSQFTIKKLTDSSWIFEKNSERFALGSKKPDGSIRIIGGMNKTFSNYDEMVAELKPVVLQNSLVDAAKEQGKIANYPVKHEKFFHVELDPIPSYSKTEDNTMRHAAGYYAVKSNNNTWTGIFCPKVETLHNAEYTGPYSSKLEMQHQVNNKNKQKSI